METSVCEERCSCSFLCLILLIKSSGSERVPITPLSHRCRETCRGDQQPEPQTRAAQEPSRSELRQRNKMRIDGDAILVLEVEGGLGESNQATQQDGSQKRSVEGNVLYGGDRKQWNHGPEKHRAPRPA